MFCKKEELDLSSTDSRVGVDLHFPAKGQARPVVVHHNGKERAVKFYKRKNVVFHVVLEDGKQVLLSWEVGSAEWHMRELD